MSEKVTILGFLGRDGFADRFAAELAWREDGDTGTAPVEVRWAQQEPGERAEFCARVLDAAMFFLNRPHPLVPDVVWVTPFADGQAIITEAVEATALSELTEAITEPALIELLAQLADLLACISADGAAHRSLTTACVHLRPDGVVRVTGFDTMGGSWSGRTVRTQFNAPGAATALAPEQGRQGVEVGPPADVFLLACLALELLLPDKKRARRVLLGLGTATEQSLSGRRDQVLAELRIGGKLKGLLTRMLAYHPQDRPDADEVLDTLEALKPDFEQLRAYAREHCRGQRAGSAAHHLVGQELHAPEEDADGLALIDAPAAEPKEMYRRSVESQPAPITPKVKPGPLAEGLQFDAAPAHTTMIRVRRPHPPRPQTHPGTSGSTALPPDQAATTFVRRPSTATGPAPLPPHPERSVPAAPPPDPGSPGTHFVKRKPAPKAAHKGARKSGPPGEALRPNQQQRAVTNPVTPENLGIHDHDPYTSRRARVRNVVILVILGLLLLTIGFGIGIGIVVAAQFAV